MGGDRRSPPHHRGRGGSGGRSRSTRGGASLSGLIGGFDQSFRLKNGNSIAKKMTGLMKESEMKVISQGADLEEERHSWVESRDSIAQDFNNSGGIDNENQGSVDSICKSEDGIQICKQKNSIDGAKGNLGKGVLSKPDATVIDFKKTVSDPSVNPVDNSDKVQRDSEGKLSGYVDNRDLLHHDVRELDRDRIEDGSKGAGSLEVEICEGLPHQDIHIPESSKHDNSCFLNGMKFNALNPIFWEKEKVLNMDVDCNINYDGNLGKENEFPAMAGRDVCMDLVRDLTTAGTKTSLKEFCIEGVCCNDSICCNDHIDPMEDRPRSGEGIGLGNVDGLQSNKDKGDTTFFKKDKPEPFVWKKKAHVLVDWSNKGRATDDGKVVKLNMEVVKENHSKLEKAIVGRLVGRKLPFYILERELRKRWEPYGEFQFLMIGEDGFTCIFNSVEARDAVLMGGPWLIGGYIVGLDRWTPTFSHDSMSGLNAPIWIRLPNLPLLYWDNDNLARIASMVGQPLWIDAVTSELGRCAYARVCVRLDLAHKLPIGVWIPGINGNFFQHVQYEGIHKVCFNYGHIGHLKETCGLSSGAPFGKNSSVSNSKEVFGWKPEISRGAEVINLRKICTSSITSITKGNSSFDMGVCNLNGAVNDGPVQADNQADEVEDPGLGPWIFISRKKGRGKRGAVKGFGITQESWKRKTHLVNRDVHMDKKKGKQTFIQESNSFHASDKFLDTDMDSGRIMMCNAESPSQGTLYDDNGKHVNLIDQPDGMPIDRDARGRFSSSSKLGNKPLVANRGKEIIEGNKAIIIHQPSQLVFSATREAAVNLDVKKKAVFNYRGTKGPSEREIG